MLWAVVTPHLRKQRMARPKNAREKKNNGASICLRHKRCSLLHFLSFLSSMRTADLVRVGLHGNAYNAEISI
jgi:hypothetical protein